MENKKTYPITDGKFGLPFTVLIIIIRAFQTHAEPMSTWSVASWVWMTIPYFFPLWLYVVMGAVRIIIDLFLMVLRKF